VTYQFSWEWADNFSLVPTSISVPINPTTLNGSLFFEPTPMGRLHVEFFGGEQPFAFDSPLEVWAPRIRISCANFPIPACSATWEFGMGGSGTGYDLDLAGLFIGPTTKAELRALRIDLSGNVVEYWTRQVHFETIAKANAEPELDTDGDGILDSADNCPAVFNPNQTDTDHDEIGDACNTAEDADGDEWSDTLDNCPSEPNSDQADRDIDDYGDACDLCPDYAIAINTDFDGNGIGDPCECGDQTQDGVVNVVDIISINLAIFGAVLTSPLCDTNFDDECDVRDIVGANRKIFGQPAYCSRYPPPEGP